jgi:GMP synthase-like glutamine amidotransferase
VAEKALIRKAVEGRGMPFLGLCLGHQLLACALGGECAKAKTPEIGVLPVQMTEMGPRESSSTMRRRRSPACNGTAPR